MQELNKTNFAIDGLFFFDKLLEYYVNIKCKDIKLNAVII